MLNFLLAIPQVVLYGCGFLIAIAIAMTVALSWRIRKVGSRLSPLTNTLKAFAEDAASKRRNGLSLATFDEIRSRCEAFDETSRSLWSVIDSYVEQYTSPVEVEGWFLTEKPREVLPYETIIGKQFHSAIFSAFPGILTGAGLTLTFVAILLALYGVHYDKANTADPITGIDTLINGLSGKFLSSIVALVLSILSTLYEKTAVRRLRTRYESMIAAISQAIPSLAQSRILLDIQRFAAKQTVSVSHISSEVVDRFVGAFNAEVVPALADGMSSGVAEKMQSEFRPTMQQMNDTLEGLKTAIVRLELQKQESVTGEIRALMASLEESLVGALSKMGADFHSALTGAASQEFGNVQGTLEATRQMLSAVPPAGMSYGAGMTNRAVHSSYASTASWQ